MSNLQGRLIFPQKGTAGYPPSLVLIYPTCPQGLLCFKMKYAYFLITDEHRKLFIVPLNLITVAKLIYKYIAVPSRQRSHSHSERYTN